MKERYVGAEQPKSTRMRDELQTKGVRRDVKKVPDTFWDVTA